jgi:hypothetical protein
VLCGGGGDQAKPVGGEAQRGADATLPLPVHRLHGRGILQYIDKKKKNFLMYEEIQNRAVAKSVLDTTPSSSPPPWPRYDSTLIKKKIKFSSYIRKFRMEQLQSQCWSLPLPVHRLHGRGITLIKKKIKFSPCIRKFRWEQLQSQCWTLPLPVHRLHGRGILQYTDKMKIKFSSYIRKFRMEQLQSNI